MLFYGRRRGGFPWLLAAVFATVAVFALVFALPGGADVSRVIAAGVFGFLIVGAVAFAIFAVWRPRRRP